MLIPSGGALCNISSACLMRIRPRALLGRKEQAAWGVDACGAERGGARPAGGGLHSTLALAGGPYPHPK